MCWQDHPAPPWGVLSPQPPSWHPQPSICGDTRGARRGQPCWQASEVPRAPRCCWGTMAGTRGLGLGDAPLGSGSGDDAGGRMWGTPGGVPSASEWPCRVPGCYRGHAEVALGGAKGCANHAGRAKVHVGQLGVRKGPCGASWGEQGPCGVSGGEQRSMWGIWDKQGPSQDKQSWEVPWAMWKPPALVGS